MLTTIKNIIAANFLARVFAVSKHFKTFYICVEKIGNEMLCDGTRRFEHISRFTIAASRESGTMVSDLSNIWLRKTSFQAAGCRAGFAVNINQIASQADSTGEFIDGADHDADACNGIVSPQSNCQEIAVGGRPMTNEDGEPFFLDGGWRRWCAWMSSLPLDRVRG